MAGRANQDETRSLLPAVLTVLFIFALVMGSGPGVLLVNPDPVDTGAASTLLGMPAVYTWAVLWFLFEAGVVLVAYFTIWRQGSDEEDSAP